MRQPRVRVRRPDPRAALGPGRRGARAAPASAAAPRALAPAAVAGRVAVDVVLAGIVASLLGGFRGLRRRARRRRAGRVAGRPLVRPAVLGRPAGVARLSPAAPDAVSATTPTDPRAPPRTTPSCSTAAAELARRAPLPREEALVDAVARAVVEHGAPATPRRRRRGAAPRRPRPAPARRAAPRPGRPRARLEQVPVEVAGEDALERAVGERERERVAGARSAPGIRDCGDRHHLGRWSRPSTGRAGAASGSRCRRPRRACARGAARGRARPAPDLVVPARPVAIGELPRAVVPLVVLRRPRGVVGVRRGIAGEGHARNVARAPTRGRRARRRRDERAAERHLDRATSAARRCRKRLRIERDRDELDRHDRVGDRERGVRRRRSGTAARGRAADERRDAGDRAARDALPRPVSAPSSRQRLGQAHAIAAPSAAARPTSSAAREPAT